MSDTNFHSKVFNDFHEIDMYAYQEVVDFYVAYEEDIQRLKFHEYFEVQVSYIDALFEVAAYENLLQACDEAIVAVIENNIQFHHGEDIYRKLLLKKAAGHYNLLEYHKAEFILEELVKINSSDFYVIGFLKKCKTQHPPKYVQYTRNTSLILFLFTALVICFEMIYFGFGKAPNAMETLIEIARNAVFLSGWLILVVGDGIFRFRISKEVNDFAKKIKSKKMVGEEVTVFLKK